MIEIIPALLVQSHQEFERRLRLVENDCRTVQVDVLDGSLFGNVSWYDARAVGALRTPVAFELHLMVENPLPIIAAWKANVPTFHRAIIHAEIKRPLGTILEHLQEVLKLEAGLAINPETPLEEVHHVLYRLHSLTFLGVHPGFSGQPFLGEMVLQKIREVRARFPALSLEIDGGVTEELLPSFQAAGIDRLCAGSLLFNSPDPRAELTRLQKLVFTSA
jgi:ribulose-phosphate 3-epimerase